MARLPSAPQTERRSARVSLVTDRGHYDGVVIGALSKAQVSVWIGTANLKDLHLEAPIGTVARARGRFVSITECFEDLARRGVEIRILHASVPSGPFRESLARRSDLRKPLFEMRACPRVHLKMIAVDGAYLYIGSANFTGAGLGARGEGRRNFEMGLSTDDDVLLDAAQARFDAIWTGKECKGCRLRDVCPGPLDEPRPTKPTAEPRAPRKPVRAVKSRPVKRRSG
jgi:phosphatidylserine/phosphatidylglycerophosphate/cardiolipin synthase-like enzyme